MDKFHTWVENWLSDLLTSAFSYITDLILKLSDIDQYIDYRPYLELTTGIAVAMLGFVVVFEATKRISGHAVDNNSGKSASTFIIQTCVSGSMIYILPHVVKWLVKLNNIIIKGIQWIGVRFGIVDSGESLLANLVEGITLGVAPIMLIVFFLVMGVSFLILSFIAGIRYLEVLFAIVISPIVATKYVSNQDAVSIWFRETCAVVFTQSVHVGLLSVMMKCFTVTNPIISVTLVVGITILMIRGPQLMRKFMYSSGTGSAAVTGAGAAGRMAAMKMMMK